jgi:hypothetical protein
MIPCRYPHTFRTATTFFGHDKRLIEELDYCYILRGKCTLNKEDNTGDESGDTASCRRTCFRRRGGTDRTMLTGSCMWLDTRGLFNRLKVFWKVLSSWLATYSPSSGIHLNDGFIGRTIEGLPAKALDAIATLDDAGRIHANLHLPV